MVQASSLQSAMDVLDIKRRAVIAELTRHRKRAPEFFISRFLNAGIDRLLF